MATPKSYFGLFARESADDKWTYEFGAWGREDVKWEKQDMHDRGYKLKNLLIVNFGQRCSQSDIDLKHRELNGEA